MCGAVCSVLTTSPLHKKNICWGWTDRSLCLIKHSKRIQLWQDKNYEQIMTYTCIYTTLAGLRTDYDVHVYIYSPGRITNSVLRTRVYIRHWQDYVQIMTYTCIYIWPWQDYVQIMTYTYIYMALAGLRTDFDVHMYTIYGPGRITYRL